MMINNVFDALFRYDVPRKRTFYKMKKKLESILSIRLNLKSIECDKFNSSLFSLIAH